MAEALALGLVPNRCCFRSHNLVGSESRRTEVSNCIRPYRWRRGISTRTHSLAAKLADAALPCFIVPIRPQFAEHLFDERLAAGGVLGADVDLALNPESVYYRAARPFVLSSPARVLWYVSKHDNYQGTMAIRACSRVVEVARGTPKQLFSRFRRLGVYEWRHVLATADGEHDKEHNGYSI